MSKQIWDEIFAGQNKSWSRIRYNPIIDIYLRNVSIRSGSKILEPGCGTGLDTLIVAKNLGLEPFLSDYSRKALETSAYFKNILQVKANLILADNRHLPFRDDFFDCVWNNGVNEHFSGNDRQLVFDEMARACKKGGYVLVAVPNSFNPFYKIEKLLSGKKWKFGFEQPFSHKELSKKMRKAGINILSKDGYGLLDSALAMFTMLLNNVRNIFNPMQTDQLRKHESGLAISFLRGINYKRAYNIYLGFVILQSGVKE